MSLTVKYIDAPEGAQEAAQISSDAGQAFSKPSSVAMGVSDIPYATLEPGVWLLDGTRELLSDTPADVGWWSNERSDDEGRFSTPPVLTFTFPNVYTATGLTFNFWPSTDQWCSEIYVAWYNGQTLLAETTAHPDSAIWTMQQKVESFDRIRMELLATNQPGQFAKLQQVQIGQVVLFGRDELISVELVNEVDPTLCELSVDTTKISIRDRKERSIVPQENQRMELYKDDRLIAAHYITESSREAQYYYSFSCQSAIGMLNDDYLGGLYDKTPVEEVLTDILGGFPYILDSAFADQTVTGYLPVCTRREALQQLAFSIGAMITTQGSDAIQLLPLPENIVRTFNRNQIFYGAKVETAPRLARAEVASHSYVPSNQEEKLIGNEEMYGSDILLTFDAPHYGYNITGGTLTGSGANWVTITANGAVTLTAKTYLHSVTLHTRRNPLATASERNNVLTVDEATLIHSGNVQDVLNRLYTAGQLRQTLTQEAVVSDHKAGERASSVNPWGTMTRGYITAMESTLTQNGHTASITILGVEVTAESVHYYSGDLYSGDEEVLY